MRSFRIGRASGIDLRVECSWIFGYPEWSSTAGGQPPKVIVMLTLPVPLGDVVGGAQSGERDRLRCR